MTSRSRPRTRLMTKASAMMVALRLAELAATRERIRGGTSDDGRASGGTRGVARSFTKWPRQLKRSTKLNETSVTGMLLRLCACGARVRAYVGTLARSRGDLLWLTTSPLASGSGSLNKNALAIARIGLRRARRLR